MVELKVSFSNKIGFNLSFLKLSAYLYDIFANNIVSELV
jgi:hypothetical protein